MDRDTAKIILGAWLRDEHTEDIKLIKASEFGELAPAAVLIASGERNPIRVAHKSGISMVEVSEMFSGKYEAMYQVAVGTYIEEYRSKWLQEHPRAKPKDIIEFLDKTKRTWMTEVPEARYMDAVIMSYLETLDERKARKTIMTGVPQLDDLTGGIVPGTMTAIGGRPGTGKSAFCLQTAINVARAGGKVMFFALEMTEAQNMDRMMMMYTKNIRQKELRDGNLTADQWAEISAATEKINEMKENLMFSDKREITAIEMMIENEKPDLVIVDQLSQLDDSTQSFMSIREQFIHMTRALMRICMENNTAVWLACQLNRDSEKRKPTLANLKESGSIEEDCDSVILLYRDEEEEQARNLQDNRVINVELAKHRGGEPGEFQMKFVVQRFGFVPLEDIPGFYETENEVEF